MNPRVQTEVVPTASSPLTTLLELPDIKRRDEIEAELTR